MNMLPFDFPNAQPTVSRPMIIDSFAGGGGASTGIEMALGRSPDVAINHDAAAIALHQANHPDTLHLNNNIWHVDPTEVVKKRRVGLAWFSPDCFPAGTMILTSKGYKDITDIVVGDLVLTHTGTWRPVTSTMKSRRKLLEISGEGTPSILVSGEHPFWARKSDHTWNKDRRGYDRTLTKPEWVKANQLRFGPAPLNSVGGDRSYWATPHKFDDLGIPEIAAAGNRTMSVTADLMWLTGRYLGDGWTRLSDDRAELVIICGHDEAASLADRLAVWPRTGERAKSDELSWTRRDLEQTTQFSTSCASLVRWLRAHFGHGASGKLIPGWAFGMEESLRKALLEGYMSADGSQLTQNGSLVRESQTVSKALALGLRSLCESLGYATRVHGPYKNRTHIQGREVNAKPIYTVRWRPNPQRSTFVKDDLHTWRPLTRRTDTGKTETVYNISVEGDESYVADGIVVHNCTHHSRAKGGKPVSRGRRDLAWVVVLWAKRARPEVILLENVAEFRDWGPLDENNRPCKERKGQTFKLWTSQLERLGYKLETRELMACDYGAPTIRKRLFMIARCDGRPIVWPEPTHAPANDPRVLMGKLKPYVTASDIIDWTQPCPSIFATKQEIKEELGLNAVRPLAEPTLRRIARGVHRHILDPQSAYIVPAGGQAALPALVQTGYGERPGQAPRSLDVDAPLGTMMAGGAKHGVVAAFLAQHNSGPGMVNSTGRRADVPLSTLTTTGSQQGVVSASLLSLHGNDRRDADIRGPHPTLCAGGTHSALVATFLREYQANSPIAPDATSASVTVDGKQYEIADIGMRMLNVPEMFRAQGFPASYDTTSGPGGRMLTKAEQTRMCGNSVCPPIAAALVSANCGHLIEAEVRVAA